MNNELKVIGSKEFMGISIPVIEGGFGEGKRIVTAKTVSEIHSARLADINATIKRMIDKSRLKVSVDYIDCLSETVSLRKFAEELELIGSNRTQNVFILSERGYTKLIKAMDDDKSWEVMDQFIDEYFTMRQVIQEVINAEDLILLKIVKAKTPEETALAVKEYQAIVTKPLIETIEKQKPLADFAKHITESSNAIDIGDFSKIVKNKVIDIGRNRLFEWLRSNEILMSNNVPYQKYIDNDWFRVIEITKDTQYGSKCFPKTLITGRGQVKILEKLRKDFIEE